MSVNLETKDKLKDMFQWEVITILLTNPNAILNGF